MCTIACFLSRVSKGRSMVFWISQSADNLLVLVNVQGGHVYVRPRRVG